ncbi:MAG: hypothetical protein NC092_01210 [Butyrivibrio sp.]|nr:hypothetical protein [Muribaculum sp.]MCM1551291.1 hypothetical protein [Butyrivibrio sp.]
MEERYTKLFTLPENLYTYGSPVIISAGALLKDNKTGNVLAQLKIQNIQAKSIKALTVKIVSYDTADRQLGEETSFQYLDLYVRRDEYFGQKIPIMLPDTYTRSFSVCVTEVVFVDHTIWTDETGGNKQWEAMAKRDTLSQTISDQEQEATKTDRENTLPLIRENINKEKKEDIAKRRVEIMAPILWVIIIIFIGFIRVALVYIPIPDVIAMMIGSIIVILSVIAVIYSFVVGIDFNHLNDLVHVFGIIAFFIIGFSLLF